MQCKRRASVQKGSELDDETTNNKRADMVDQQAIYQISEDFAAFVKGLAKESDRSAVILGAARLDVSLERLLKSIMSHHPGGQDNLFDPDRPLSSLSAKIALAYRLGLITNNVEHALQMVRKIRNDFAHSIEDASLADAPHKDRAAELGRAAARDRNWEDFRGTFRRSVEAESLADFCATITCLMVRLEVGVLLLQIDAPLKIETFPTVTFN